MFEHLLATRPEDISARAHRSFYRRVARWKREHGAPREVFFPQARTPGASLQLDWTHAGELAVKIGGEAFPHLLCHAVLPYSNWEWAVPCRSESFLSLKAGLSAALWELGGVPGQSGLPAGKTLGVVNETRLPEKVRRQLPSLLTGKFIRRGDNLPTFGLPGRGKTLFVAALGHELITRHQLEILFTATFKLVTQLLAAKRDLKLPNLLARLDRFDAVILDDLGYVQQSREEMEVLFTFLAERYEKRSVIITSNLVFSQWDQIFKDPMTTMAAIDRLVHHATILEFTGDSHRARLAKAKTKT